MLGNFDPYIYTSAPFHWNATLGTWVKWQSGAPGCAQQAASLAGHLLSRSVLPTPVSTLGEVLMHGVLVSDL